MTEPHAAVPEGERLQKVLARAGFGSRRACEELIEDRRVRVNGELAELGRRVDVEHDRVEVDGRPVGVLPGRVYYLLNKPAGVVTTASDPQGRRTVLDLLPPEPRVFPVGRLDLDTEGLIVCTNDGELAQLLAHPSHGVEKEYLAVVEGDPGPQAIRRLREGVEIGDGLTAPARVSRRSAGVLRIVIHEGRNRQVRRMCEAVGHPVRRLVRTRVGPLGDARLAPGAWRPLTLDEVRALAGGSTRPPTPRRGRPGTGE
ncbi:MAG TPA: pseudouridine synthase [Acidimicrobiales bacterium]|nr:pseudouridine synthase [Acidimicrobiales bacterium]